MLDRQNQRWDPDYAYLFKWRQEQVLRLHRNPKLLAAAMIYYRTRPAEFINHWCDTFDTRNALAALTDPEQETNEPPLVRMPFVLFKRQVETVEFLQACINAQANGLIEKSRELGATWVCAAFSVWLWLFVPGASIGWGSRKMDLVDKIGVMDSIFEKLRTLIKGLPPLFWPEGFIQDDHLSFMRILNPKTGADITGESGDDIGRGGRKLIYFKDESAQYAHPEAIEASLSENTRCQIDISSVNGLGNVFHRKREAGVEWEPGKRAVRGHTNVFIFDWRDDPRKNQAWYDMKYADFEEQGLLHVFRQEVDRNYASSVEGVIILPEWVNASIDAHKVIPGMEEGPWSAALDVADEGKDRNAQIKRKGVVLKSAQEWGERDVGVTARRSIDDCRDHCPMVLYYDSVGMGATVKAEVNRLNDEKLLSKGLKVLPWSAGGKVLNPEDRVNPNDAKSPANEDFFHNLKAQGWWMLARRFERTYRMLTKGIQYPVSSLISIDSQCGKVRQLQKELSQPTMGKSGSLKLLVNKTPDGSRSPNLGDGTMMVYWPIPELYDSSMSWV